MPGHRKPELSVTGLVAGAAATVTATVAASYFGVGGTLIGAGAVSVLSTVGATFYQHFLDRGKAQLVAKIPVRVLAGDATPAESEPVPASRRTGGRSWPKWYVVGGAAAGVFLAVMGLVTTFELFTGKPLANTVQGRAGHGTSVHPVRTGDHPSPGPTTSGGATPDTTPSARVTLARTPQVTPSPSASAVPPPAASAAPATPPNGGELTRSPAPAQQPPADDTDVRPLRTP